MKQFIEQITLEEMRDELQRELKMRERVYPRWIENKRLTKDEADLRILKMKACLACIESDLQKKSAQGGLFQ